MKIKIDTHNYLENPKRYGGLIFLLPSIEIGFGECFYSLTISWICWTIDFNFIKQ
jgi:hypothetical protein